MKVYEYKSYEEYVEEQIKANSLKLDNVWVHPDTITEISRNVPNNFVTHILCHGSRNGAELGHFRFEYPLAERILGTEISPTAKQYDNTIQHDFHEEREEWLEKFDIVYSNSLDHSYDPVKALTTWDRQLSGNGVLCVELMLYKFNACTPSDPLEISEEDYLDIIENQLGHKCFHIFRTEYDNSDSRVFMSIKK